METVKIGSAWFVPEYVSGLETLRYSYGDVTFQVTTRRS